MDYYSKDVKYKNKYLELKKMIGGASADTTADPATLLPKPMGKFTKRILKETAGMIDPDIIKDVKSNTPYKLNYKGRDFTIIYLNGYPLSQGFSINGFTHTEWGIPFSVAYVLDRIFSVDKPNTLVYCHPLNTVHWMSHTWEQIFGDQFTGSNKIYFDIKLVNKGHNIFVADGFSDEFLEVNKELWDLVMVPDCGAKTGELPLYDFTMNSKNRGEDAPKALPIIEKLLGLLKAGGKLWLTKTVTVELARLLPEHLGERFQIEYLKHKEGGMAEGDAVKIWHEITDISVIDKPDEFGGVIITRLL